MRPASFARFVAPAVALVLAVSCGAPAPEPTPGAQRLAVAVEEAAERGVPLLIDFYTDW